MFVSRVVFEAVLDKAFKISADSESNLFFFQVAFEYESAPPFLKEKMMLLNIYF